jgi:hypothetical protein
MRLLLKTMLVVGALALGAAPALAHGKPENVPPTEHGSPANEHAKGGNGQGNGPNYQPAQPTPGPKAGLPEKAKAYGRYCKGESRQHVKGKKGTPFSECVTAAAKAAQNEDLNPHRAGAGMSKEHVKGKKGTPYSECVTGVAHMRREEHRKQKQEEQEAKA